MTKKPSPDPEHLHRPVEPHSNKATATNVRIILLASLGSFSFGYANNAVTGTLAQASFNVKFLSGSNANSVVGGILGGQAPPYGTTNTDFFFRFLGGAFIGSLLQSPMSSRWGRRIATAVAAVLLTVASALMAGSVHIAMFITARTLSGIAAGILTSNTPVYMSEISPPAVRGLMTSAHGVGITAGYIFSSILALGFNFVTHSYQWRLQFVILTFTSILLLVTAFMVPESPRWLAEKQRYDEAHVVLESLHGSGDSSSLRWAHAEMAQIKAQLESDRSHHATILDMFTKPSLRKRTICSIIVWILNIGSGCLVVANLTPLLFKRLGFSIEVQLGLSIVWVVCAAIGASVNGLLLDRFGRRPLLIIGGYLTAAALLTEALLQKYYLQTTYKPGLNAATAMFFIFILIWGAFLDNTTYVYVPEIWPTNLRSRGSSIAFLSYYSVAIATNCPAPQAFATIGYKYYLVFFSLAISAATYIVFKFPETAGLTLEEIGAKFGDRVELTFEDAIACEVSEDQKDNLQGQMIEEGSKSK